ncbi:hypothetical protein LTR28_013297, partial [Elasticomyces elasticus]
MFLARLTAPSTPFDPPSTLHLILSSPLKLFLRLSYRFVSSLRSPPQPPPFPIRVVCLSDTHCSIPTEVPAGDLLVHAGDLSNAGTPSELQSQIDWLDSLPHRHKVVIAGNHDSYLDPRSRTTLAPSDQVSTLDWKSLHYLQHSPITLTFPEHDERKLTVYGAPHIPACGGGAFAFQYPRGTDAWSDTLPKDLDVLLTHAPPKYHLDLPAALGCEWLLKEVWRVKPRLHIFGH